MSTALSLTNKGYEVELFEKNSRLGGKLNVLKKEGFSFDLGPSILTFPHVFERLFTEAGKRMEDYFKIKEPDIHWRCFFEDGERIDLSGNIEKIKGIGNSLSDSDIADLKEFLAYSKSFACMFDVKVSAVSKHLKNIFDSGELDENSVVSI